MQSKTRYVSIQYGIGGHQTFPAQDVINRGFGDCKALSNYMHSLLKEAGIKSHYTLVYSGRNSYRLLDYSKVKINYFNHVILCLPTINDTLWLECTSQTQPFGYQGSYTSDRQVLIIEKDKSKIVYTKSYGYKDNITKRTSDVIIQDDGTVNASLKSEYHYEASDDIAGYYFQSSVEDFKKYLSTRFNIPSYSVSNYAYEYHKDSKPILNEKLDISLPYYANKSGKRLFITPNIFGKSTQMYKPDSTRTQPFTFTKGKTIIDSITLNIPPTYSIESLAKDINEKFEFLEYSTNIIKKETQLIYIRKLVFKEGTYPASISNILSNAFKKIGDADKAKIVFVLK